MPNSALSNKYPQLPVPVTDGGTNITTYTKGDLLVASGASVLNKLPVGNDGQALFADSAQATGIKWGGLPKTVIPIIILQPEISSTGAWGIAVGGSGARTQDQTGARVETGATATSFAYLQKQNMQGGAWNYWGQVVQVGMYWRFNADGSDYDFWAGCGGVTITGSAITYTTQQMGMKRTRAGGGSMVLSATNANGVSETATAVTDYGNGAFTVKKSSTPDIKFYRATTLLATHTTNLPSDYHTYILGLAVSNKGVASNTILTLEAMNFIYENGS